MPTTKLDSNSPIVLSLNALYLNLFMEQLPTVTTQIPTLLKSDFRLKSGKELSTNFTASIKALQKAISETLDLYEKMGISKSPVEEYIRSSPDYAGENGSGH